MTSEYNLAPWARKLRSIPLRRGAYRQRTIPCHVEEVMKVACGPTSAFPKVEAMVPPWGREAFFVGGGGEPNGLIIIHVSCYENATLN
jgi:hypothetical protein